MLHHRIVVAIIGIPFLLFMSYVGGIPFLFTVCCIVVWSLYEFYWIAGLVNFRPFRTAGILGSLFLCFNAFGSWEPGTGLIFTFLILVVFLFQIARQDIPSAISSVSVTVFGVLYIGWLGSYLIMIRRLPASGTQYIYLLFMSTWLIDNGAYTAGKLWGKHKLIESISPKKTVEGVIGASISGIAALFVARWWFLHQLSVSDCILLGLALSIIAVFGDLAESVLKRNAGIKDTGTVLPGHGGMLDRFDSILFTAPALYYYIKFFLS